MGASTMVRVYLNLHRTKAAGRKVYSVQGRTEKGWRVESYTPQLALRFARFVVSEAGRARARAEGRRNVHAFVEGLPLHVGAARWLVPSEDWWEVRYSPWSECPGFSRVPSGSLQPGPNLFAARYAILDWQGLHATGLIEA